VTIDCGDENIQRMGNVSDRRAHCQMEEKPNGQGRQMAFFLPASVIHYGRPIFIHTLCISTRPR
jgi:hypothetical protein